jgi:hypothetical protein
MSDAGIEASHALKTTMEELGFDAGEIAELAGIGPPNGEKPNGPPPPSNANSSSTINQDNVELLQSILDQYSDLSQLNASQETQLGQSLFDAGLLEPGSLIDTES